MKTNQDDSLHPRHICREHFLPKNCLWIIFPIGLAIAGAAITWSLETNISIGSLETKAEYHDLRITQMETFINKVDKLDSSMNKKMDKILDLVQEK